MAGPARRSRGGEGPSPSRLRRRWAAATVVVVVAMAVPVVLDHDDFPLSTYPMYSSARPRESALVTAVGLDDRDEPVRLGLGLVGASDDPLIVAAGLRDDVAAGRAQARCEAVAGRVAGAGGSWRRVVAVEVVTERVDLVGEVVGDPPPLDRTVHARCGVAGR